MSIAELAGAGGAMIVTGMKAGSDLTGTLSTSTASRRLHHQNWDSTIRRPSQKSRTPRPLARHSCSTRRHRSCFAASIPRAMPDSLWETGNLASNLPDDGRTSDYRTLTGEQQKQTPMDRVRIINL